MLRGGVFRKQINRREVSGALTQESQTGWQQVKDDFTNDRGHFARINFAMRFMRERASVNLQNHFSEESIGVGTAVSGSL